MALLSRALSRTIPGSLDVISFEQEDLSSFFSYSRNAGLNIPMAVSFGPRPGSVVPISFSSDGPKICSTLYQASRVTILPMPRRLHSTATGYCSALAAANPVATSYKKV